MDTPGNDANIEPPNVNGNNTTNTPIGMIIMGNNPMVESSSCSSMVDSFCPPIWDQPIIDGTSWMPNAVASGSMFLSTVPRIVPSSLPHFPADSCFVDQAARFSCFSGGHFNQMVNPFRDPDHPNPNSDSGLMLQRPPNEDLVGKGLNPSVREASEENIARSRDEVKHGVDLLGTRPDEAEFSGGQDEFDGTAGEFSGKVVGLKKRKRTQQKNVNNEDQQSAGIEIRQNGDEKPSLTGNRGGKGSDPPKEEYIHVRARRGQATNSHSVAERIRREKISQRMKFLQDLVPGCSKVTGKAVMLDEIINYVQSLQRQVEFLSMKLATVNPRFDFNMDGFIAKDVPETRTGLCLSSSFGFSRNVTMPCTSIPPGPIQAGLPSLGDSSEALRMPISLQTNVVSEGLLREPTSQAPSVWDDELHNIVHNGLNSSAPPNSSDLNGHTKAEP